MTILDIFFSSQEASASNLQDMIWVQYLLSGSDISPTAGDYGLLQDMIQVQYLLSRSDISPRAYFLSHKYTFLISNYDLGNSSWIWIQKLEPWFWGKKRKFS